MAPGSWPKGAFIAAGIALIVAPWLGWAIHLPTFGWMVVILFYTLFTIPVLILGYVIQVVLGSLGFFGRRPIFAALAQSWRPLTAAWVSSIAIIVVGFTLVDGGDTGGAGSTAMRWFGLMDDRAASGVSSVIMLGAIALWLAGWLWLVVEWIVALVVRRRSVRAAA